MRVFKLGAAPFPVICACFIKVGSQYQLRIQIFYRRIRLGMVRKRKGVFCQGKTRLKR